MAVTTKKQFPNAVGVNGQSATVFTPVGIQLNNQDDLDVYVTLSGGTRVLQLRQTSGSTATSSHPQVNNTDGLYFPAVSVGTTLYNYTLSTDNNTITFSTALPSGATVFCERRTRDADSSYTTFASGSTIRATDLNNSSTESNFTAQDGRNKVFEIEGVLFRGDQPSTNYVTTDHIVNDSVTADKIPDDTINSEHYVASSIDLEHMSANSVDSDQYVDGSIDEVHISNSAVTQNKLADNSVGTPEIINGSVTDAKIATGTLDNRYFTETELDPNASAGANVLDARYYTETEADARFYNVASAEEIQSGETWVAADNKVATTAAIDARIIDLVDDVGGFHPIPNETSFPSVNVDVNNGAGTLISIKEIVTARTPSSGVVTIANGAGSSTVTITGCGSTVLAAGFGAIVETTSTLHTYAFHRLQPKATEVTTVAGSIANVNTTAGSIGNVNIVGPDIANVNTVAGSIGSVNTVAGSISSVNNASSNISSINNFGDLYQVNSSNPSTDGGGASLAAGDLYFNTSADRLKVYNGTDWVDGVIASGGGAQTSGDTFTGDLKLNDNVKLLIGTGSDLEIYHNGSASLIDNKNANNFFIRNLASNIYYDAVSHNLRNEGGTELMITATRNGAVDLYYDNSKKFETTANGITATGTQHIFTSGTSGDCELIIAADSDNNNENDNPRIIFKQDGSHTSNSIGVNHPNGTDQNDLYIANGALGGDIGFWTGYDSNANASWSGATQRLTIKSNGDVQIPSDSGKLQLGASNDLEIFHSGTNSYIQDNGTGGLYIGSNNTSGGGVYIRGKHGEESIIANSNGSVELYYDNNKKFETTSTGNKSTGTFEFLHSTGAARAKVTADGNYKNEDGIKFIAGTGNDLQIYHDGSNSFIDESSGTGSLIVRTSKFNIKTENSAETMATFTKDGAVELYHDNTKKFETASTGVTVSGNIFLEDDNGGDTLRKLVVGSGNDLIIYHDGSNSYIKEQGTGSLILESNHLITKAAAYSFQNANNTESLIYAVENGKVELFFNGSSKFETTTTGTTITGRTRQNVNSSTVFPTSFSTYAYTPYDHEMVLFNQTGGNEGSFAGIYFNAGADSDGSKVGTARISAVETGDYKADLVFSTRNSSFTEKLRILADGKIRLPNDSQELQFGAAQDLKIYHDGNSVIDSDSGYLKITANSNDVYIQSDSDVHITSHNAGETMAKFTKDGAAELYHNNVKKLETTSTGATVTGTLQADSYGDIKLADPFIEMAQTITTSRTISNNYNAFTVGPVTINTGVTVTVGDGENWVIV